MANFNDQVNNYIGRYSANRPLEIRRVDTVKAFERAISGWMNDYFNPDSSEYKSKEKLASMDSVFQDGQFDIMDECDIHCSLYILYKEEHRVQKLAGRCFSWDNAKEEFIGIKGEELKLEKGRYLSNRNGFCIPRFDAMQAAVLITDYEVVAYGDSYIEAEGMDEDLVHCNVYVGYGLVADIHIDTKEFDICTVSLCGSAVSFFRIPEEVFDSFFGLKENFQDQYEKVFGKTEEAKSVQEENDLIEEAKRNIESCMNLLDTHECQLERAMDAIKLALIDIDEQKCELGVMLAKLDDTLRELK